MATTQLQLLRSVDQFVDACRRFIFVAERWNSTPTQLPMDGVDWKATQKFERYEIQVALRAIEPAADRLLKDSDALDAKFPEQWRTVIRSAPSLGKYACDEARKAGWFDGQIGVLKGSHITVSLQKAVGWLSFLSEVMTVQGLSHAVREVFQAILLHGPTRGDDLANFAKGADVQDSTFREMLSEMVEDGLLHSGRGRYSTGYRLTDRGMQLAQLSGQLTDF